jgi:hypothetical protein
MRRWFVLLIVLAGAARADGGDLTTYYEKSGYKATPRYAETVDYCKRLAQSSRWIHYTSFGKTPQGRDLPLLVVDKDGNFSANRVRRRTRAVLLIQAGIHPGESDGKDAGFMLIRDIAATREYEDIIDHVTILFMPIFNVDGHERFGPYNRINQNGPEEMGWRVTAQNLNLNRDYLKADAPEMRAWIRLFNKWEPDFLVDCHVTDGADYQYVLTYIMEIHGNMAPPMTDWTRDVYLEGVKTSMLDAGVEMFPYVFPVKWPHVKDGIVSWAATPRFAQGYAAIRNRPGLLIETHMLKDYKSRVTATYEMLKQTVELLNREYKGLKHAIKDAKALTASAEFRKEPFPLKFRASGDSTMIDFKGFEYETVESEISGGTWHKYSDQPTTFRIPYHDKQDVVAVANLPGAYVVPGEWKQVIELIELHGVEFTRLDKATTVPVTSYRFRNLSWQERPYEGRHPVKFEMDALEEEWEFMAGSIVIDMNQPAARVAAHILEPEGPDSYLQWGFFDAIFEQKEYASGYMMEQIARDMLAKDEDLQKEFESMRAENPDMKPWPILNWFYQKTPYWDAKKDIYPVGKVFDSSALKSLGL